MGFSSASPLAASLITFVLSTVFYSRLHTHTCQWTSPLLPSPVYTSSSYATGTHEPYATDPPSFKNSSYYRSICKSASQGQEDQHQDCAIQPYAIRIEEPLPACTPGELSVWNGTGQWFQEADGHFKLYLGSLNLSPYGSCLQVGDSLTRYQYLSMAHFLSRGHWPERYGGNDEFGPNVVIEKEFDLNWSVFFNRTSALLSNARGAKSFESCNCKREDQTEQRQLDVHSFPVEGSREAGYLTIGNSFITFDYRERKMLQSAIQAFAQQPGVYDAGAVLYNVGWWVGDNNFDFLPTILNEVPMAMPQLVPHNLPQPRLFWKSITTKGDPNDEDAKKEAGDLLARQHLKPPWELYDVRAVTAQAQAQQLNLRIDQLHFMPIMYEMLNDILLNMLCDGKLNFVRDTPSAA